MRIQFVRDALFESEGRHKGKMYKSGEIYDVSPDFAQRWMRRGAAIEAKDSPEVEVPTKNPPEPNGTDQKVEVPTKNPPPKVGILSRSF